MIKEQLTVISENIEKCRVKNGIEYPVSLLAVSKTYPVEVVREAISEGILLFGENRVQEAFSKFNDPDILKSEAKVHIIGHLQRNKARDAVRVSSMIQSIDSIKTLVELEKQCINQDKSIDYLIEINTSYEEQKHGIDPKDVSKFIDEINQKSFASCTLKGLMTVGPLTNDVAVIRKSFRELKNIFDLLKTELGSESMEILSMGMSGDYLIAIEEGSTMVRVGSALFGRRDYN